MGAPERVKSLCACPRCRSSLAWSERETRCVSCRTAFEIASGVPLLLPARDAVPTASAEWYPGGAQRLLPPLLQGLARRYARWLNPGLSYKGASTADLVPRFVRSFSPADVVLNVGAGDTRYGPNVLNLDIAPAPTVDVVGIAERLPLRAASCDGIVLQAVLEHVQNANQTLGEIRRVLKPGGAVFVEVPFMQGFHPAPGDFRRYTEQGLRAELQDHGFDVIASGVAVGPASAMAWVTAEFLALAASGRNANIYRILRPLVGCVVFPLKYLDASLESHPMAYTIASGVWARAVRQNSIGRAEP